jgi:hypothetical protein
MKTNAGREERAVARADVPLLDAATARVAAATAATVASGNTRAETEVAQQQVGLLRTPEHPRRRVVIFPRDDD